MSKNAAGPADPDARAKPAGLFGMALMSRRGAATLLLIAGILALGGALASGGLEAQKRRAQSQQLYAHTLEVMAAARETMSAMQDMALGQRGYLLSRDRAALEPYRRASGEVDGLLAGLTDLTQDNPRHRDLMTRLSQLLADLRLNLGFAIDRAETGDFDGAVALYRSGAAKQIMDDIRSAMRDIFAEEDRLLIERREANREAGRTLGYYLLGLAILGVGLIGFAAYSAFVAMSAGMRADAERERATSALRLASSERRFRTITEAMPQIVWSSTAAGRFDFVNARWQAYTGSPGTQETWIDHIHPDDRPGVSQAWRRSIETGDIYAREVRLRGADGGYRWFLCRAVPVRNEAGDVEHWLGTGTDIHETRLNLEARELLSQELSHRIKNIFSVVGSLVSLSARSNPGQAVFASALRDRIAALGRAHEFVRPHSPESAALRGDRTFSAFVKELLGAYSDRVSERVRFSGDDFTFGDKSATPLALFFHELGTNAAKYGALSEADGRVEITARREDATISIVWKETGGPPIDGDPTREGFGTTLARLSIEGQLGGAVMKAWELDGLRVIVSVPGYVLAQV
jgi:PAS domain S-box-containing protein